MENLFPTSSAVWLAIDIYLKHAYDGPPPLSVRDRLATLKQQPGETFYDCAVWERDSKNPAKRYSLRLGNRRYPHMKLSIEQTADGSEFFFKADTHDRHCCPDTKSPEYQAFLALSESNEALAKKIETAWSAAGIATFREFLRNDLTRRLAAAQASGPMKD